ncbi:CD209 antigen-like protein B isoform X3 [Erpetoichthys calabaricus]|uniref:CD209 antigen-like protein B isoform X3 n=1 Tax=Erpetoichthys calabaricus TaxID=27687 RepID=UPI002234BCED|nr:CD209 antigen-like protein B isoform X3 [Erpetoichthys calabaricus]
MAEEHDYATVSFAPQQMELTEREISEPKEPNDEITYAEVKFVKPLNHQEKDFQMVPREEVIYAEVKCTNLQQKNSNSQTDASDINKDNADAHCRTEWKTPGDEKQSNGDTTKVSSTKDKQRFSPLKLLLILLFSLLLAVASSLSVYYTTNSKYKENEDTLLLSLSRTQEEFKMLQANVTVLQQNVLQLQNENSALNESYRELQFQNEELRNSNTELQSNNEQLKKNNTELQSNNEELKKNNNELYSNHSELHSRYSSLRENLTELTVRFRALDEYCPVINQLTQKRKCAVCPENWLGFSGKCYFFSNETMNWNASRNKCKSINGDLVIIETAEEQSFLIKTTKNKRGAEQQGKYWIGLTGHVTEKQFVWVDSRPLDVNSRFWAKRDQDDKFEPDNWTQNNLNGEDCVQLQVNNKYDGWYDGDCGDKQKWICEITMA